MIDHRFIFQSILNSIPVVLLMILLWPFAGASLTAQQLQFNIQSSGSNTAIDSAARYAAELWSPFLRSNIPVKVNFNFISLGAGGTLGVTVPNGRKDFAGAPTENIWYPTSLANAIANTELNPGEVDMDIVMNSDVNWYFGTDGNPGFNQYDFVSVFMHELGHGLGILSLAKVENGMGSFGEITALDFLGIATFPFPMLDGRPGVFDLFVVNDSDQLLVDTNLYANLSGQLGTELTSGRIFFNGPNALLANSPDAVKLYAPNSFALGSSVLHLDESTFPPADSNSLMTPFSGMGEVEHHPGAIIIGILEDIGWPSSVYPLHVSSAAHPTSELKVYQTNAQQITFTYHLNRRGPVELDLFDLSGRLIARLVHSEQQQGRHQATWEAATLLNTPFLVYRFRAGAGIRSGKLFLQH